MKKLCLKYGATSLSLFFLLCLSFIVGKPSSAEIATSSIVWYYDFSSGSELNQVYNNTTWTLTEFESGGTSVNYSSGKFGNSIESPDNTGDASAGSGYYYWQNLHHEWETPNEFSYSFWYNASSSPSNFASLLTTWSALSIRWFNNGTIKMDSRDASGNWVSSDCASFFNADGVWHNVVVQGTQGGTIDFYSDGEVVCSNVAMADLGDISDNGYILGFMGNHIYGGSESVAYAFRGKLDDFALFNRELTTTEISAIQTQSIEDYITNGDAVLGVEVEPTFPTSSEFVLLSGSNNDVPVYYDFCDASYQVIVDYASSSNYSLSDLSLGMWIVPTGFYDVGSSLDYWDSFTEPNQALFMSLPLNGRSCNGVAYVPINYVSASLSGEFDVLFTIGDVVSQAPVVVGKSVDYRSYTKNMNEDIVFLENAMASPFYVDLRKSTSTYATYNYNLTGFDLNATSSEICLYSDSEEELLENTCVSTSGFASTGFKFIDLPVLSEGDSVSLHFVYMVSDAEVLRANGSFVISFYRSINTAIDYSGIISKYINTNDPNKQNYCSKFPLLIRPACYVFKGVIDWVVLPFVDLAGEFFPFNLAFIVRDSYDASADADLPASFDSFMPNDNGDVGFYIPVKFYGSGEYNKFIIFGPSLFHSHPYNSTEYNDEGLIPFLRELSGYFMAGIFFWAIVRSANKLYKELNDN